MTHALGLMSLIAAESQAKAWEAAGEVVRSLRDEFSAAIENERGHRMPWSRN